jgi:hypothetical protein
MGGISTASESFQRRSPAKPDKHSPIRNAEPVPVGFTEATARCAKRNASGASGRRFLGSASCRKPLRGGEQATETLVVRAGPRAKRSLLW